MNGYGQRRLRGCRNRLLGLQLVVHAPGLQIIAGFTLVRYASVKKQQQRRRNEDDFAAMRRRSANREGGDDELTVTGP